MDKEEDKILHNELVDFYTRKMLFSQPAIYEDYVYDVVGDKIRAKKYKKYKKVNTIEVPDAFEIIGSHCFSSCRYLQGIELGSNIKKLEDSPFDGCLDLEFLILNDGLEDIGEFCLDRCLLTHLTFPHSVKRCKKFLIENLPYLESITFGPYFCDMRNISQFSFFVSNYPSDEIDYYFESNFLDSYIIKYYYSPYYNGEAKFYVNGMDITEKVYSMGTFKYTYVNNKHYIDGKEI